MAGIYIHIPFCKQACHYCDFHFSTSLGKKNEMITAIQKELFLRKSELEQTTIETIYFGGGTPSMLSFEEIEAILESVYENYTITDNPEITLEANPDDLTEAKIKEFSKSKINRLSIGIQSFFDTHLQFMNRAHAGDEAIKCLEIATQYFDNITIDLMYGIPKMTMQEWKENLEIAFSFNVNHISSYVLTVEPKTALEKFIRQGTCPDVSGSESWAHFSMLVEETEKQGYIQYEISSFGKPGCFSKHNSSYWKGATYIGIGPGAHSFDKKSRSWNVSNNPLYIKSIAKDIVPITKEILSLDDQYNEYVMTGVRTIWGISLAYIQEEFGEVYVQHTLKVAASHLQEKNIQLEANIIRTTQKGQFLCDGIAADFFRV
ncbi:radical SAM family heme chaperone HemW [Kordia sp. YSTF-M3]|uniref:Heme chaperone HemW n=1 Tax=Kordia aestuariivivens TaxID=2759037 RepID=A0ABR7Q460_9FLAO|nr:radical SAM family heme chaperone HemW [Kordia aestuariivivens]MBC8753186.1 radical SAM family heme chaperone HemW [Kordia aestuariivivens]